MRRGTPQGCPISPFLLNLAVDPWLRAMARDHNLEGIQLSADIAIRCMAFSDDTVLGIAIQEDLSQVHGVAGTVPDNLWGQGQLGEIPSLGTGQVGERTP